jgi:hypothetical protein
MSLLGHKLILVCRFQDVEWYIDLCKFSFSCEKLLGCVIEVLLKPCTKIIEVLVIEMDNFGIDNVKMVMELVD